MVTPWAPSTLHNLHGYAGVARALFLHLRLGTYGMLQAPKPLYAGGGGIRGLP